MVNLKKTPYHNYTINLYSSMAASVNLDFYSSLLQVPGTRTGLHIIVEYVVKTLDIKNIPQDKQLQ